MCERLTPTHCSVVALVAAILCAIAARSEADPRPNVILILTDDQGYGDLACHGNPWLKTPALDRLHSQSVRFTNFHVSPTCAPTRAALMTGRYSNRCGVWHTVMGRSLLLRDERTVADELGAAGYATAIFGKWHLGDNAGLLPQDRGFQHAVIHGGGGVGQTPDYWGNDYFDDTYFVNGEPTPMSGYCTDVWFREAIRFIERQDDRPFFAYISTNAPHGPYYVDERYAAPYRGDDRIINPEFCGMIANIDENVARLDAALEERGLAERTIVIFMTDNGTAAGYNPASGKGYNAGMRGRKASHYDGGHRVPCFVRWPGRLGEPRDVPQIAAHIDVLPTLLESCGVEREGALPLDGVSLAPLLRGDAADWPERAITVDNQRESYPRQFKEYSVMTDRWRLCGDGRRMELYDAQADPGQQTNVASSHPAVTARLKQEYLDWWTSQESRFVLPQTIDIDAEGVETPLTAHDWHCRGVERVWNQASIKKGPLVNGAWAVNVRAAGRYRIGLRRWPKERGGAINEGLPIAVTRAVVNVGGSRVETEVRDDDEEAVLRLELQAGTHMLETEFAAQDGRTLSAYYAYVVRE